MIQNYSFRYEANFAYASFSGEDALADHQTTLPIKNKVMEPLL